MYSSCGNYMLDILFYKKVNWNKKTFFGHFDQKQKCSVFTFVQYRYIVLGIPYYMMICLFSMKVNLTLFLGSMAYVIIQFFFLFFT